MKGVSRGVGPTNAVRLARIVMGAMALVSVTACSLVSLKSPERPLSPRDLNARILTREYSSHFTAAVEQCADVIMETETDPLVINNALRWKIAAVTESQRAATRMSPMMGLVDTWSLAIQMRDFMSESGAGRNLFGTHQGAAQAVSTSLADEAEALVKRVVAPGDLGRYQKFVETYAREHPLQSLEFVRPSVVELWSRENASNVKLVDSLGTIPEAMADVSDRLQMYGDTVPSRAMWRTQLALRESGYSRSDIQPALDKLDDRLNRLSLDADNAPELVRQAVAEVRRSVVDVLNRVDASSASLIRALDVEREALSATVRSEREAVANEVDGQRKALAADASRIADQVVNTAGEQVRHLVREVVLLLIVMFVIVLGLPFAAGYAVGRARRGRSAEAG